MDGFANRSNHEDVIAIFKRLAIKMVIISKTHTQEQKVKDIIVSSLQDSIMVDGNRNNGLQYVPLYLQQSNVAGADLKAEHLPFLFAMMLGSSLTSTRDAIHCCQNEDREEGIFGRLLEQTPCIDKTPLVVVNAIKVW